MTTDQKTDFWGIVEVMGHRRFAGRVTEQVIGGQSFVRIDVPELAGRPAFSKLFGGGAIYCITPVAEDVARALAEAAREEPVSVYDLPEEWRSKLRGLPSPVSHLDDGDYDEDHPI